MSETSAIYGQCFACGRPLGATVIWIGSEPFHMACAPQSHQFFTPIAPVDQPLVCGHTMAVWYFKDEASGHGFCAVCEIPKLNKRLDALEADADELARVLKVLEDFGVEPGEGERIADVVEHQCKRSEDCDDMAVQLSQAGRKVRWRALREGADLLDAVSYTAAAEMIRQLSEKAAN